MMSKLRQDVKQMLENEGVYLAFDPEHPNVLVPIVARDGKILCMRMDRELDPRRFFERTRFHGPFWPTESNEIPIA